MPKRSSERRSSSPSSGSSEVSSSRESTAARARKRFRSSSIASSLGQSTSPAPKVLKVYIVQEKIDADTIRELYDIVESHEDPSNLLALELCASPEDADIIITAIRMKKRLQRHVNWNTARQRPILTPAWLRESAKQGRPVACGDFAALRELHDETVARCPDIAPNLTQAPAVPSSSSAAPSSRKAAPETKPTTPRVFDNWRAKYACERASPLVCPNQALAVELAVLNRERELEGNNMSALSYEKSVSVSYPYPITHETYERDVVKLPGLGTKTLSKIKEFMKNGYIEETRETRKSERFQSLSAFTSIYGIGPANARMLYERGLRTVEDLERYYDVTPNTLSELKAATTPNGKAIPTPLTEAVATPGVLGLSPSGGLSGSSKSPSKSKISKAKSKSKKLPDMSIQIALALRADFAVPIPRSEVEEMHRVVMQELDVVQPGCVGIVVGSYRRGKAESADVDMVITHEDGERGAEIVKGLCARFARHLYERGLVTQVMGLSSFHAPDALRTENWDSLEKALTVFKLPLDKKDDKKPRLHRRLDLIFAAPQAYWTAVVGWSGSKMFERDLRLWAKMEKGMKFDSSGLTRRHDSKLLVPKSEEEVFSLLGLDWIDPTMRNADV